jgi:hypothetical protein
MRVSYGGVEWGRYYLYWWNWLPKSHRYWGIKYVYYDGPHGSFGLWFVNVSWCFPWTSIDH